MITKLQTNFLITDWGDPNFDANVHHNFNELKVMGPKIDIVTGEIDVIKEYFVITKTNFDDKKEDFDTKKNEFDIQIQDFNSKYFYVEDIEATNAAIVGLEKVDNTSDTDKPVSTAQQVEFDKKATVNALNELDTKIQNKTQVSLTACSLLLTGTVTIKGNNLDYIDAGHIYIDGKNIDGSYKKVSEGALTGSYDFTGVADGKYYLAREYGTGALKAYNEFPALKPNGTNIWFNTKDGKHYQSSSTIIADGSTNISDIDAVPIMTSNTSQSGEASSSSTLSPTYTAWRAFNKIVETDSWIGDGLTGWLQYKFYISKVINKYVITGQDDTNRQPKDWVLKASNTGAFSGEEVNLSVITDQVSWIAGEARTYTFTNDVAYAYYRLDISANNGNASYIELEALKLIEAEIKVLDGAPLTTPISFISKYPYMIVSETPQHEMVNEKAISTNVIESLTVADNLEIIGMICSTGGMKLIGLETVDPLIDGVTWNNNGILAISGGI